MQPRVRLNLLKQSVAVGLRRIPLTGRQLEVLALLARRRGLLPGSRISELLWPDRDTRCGAALIKVLVHRLRRNVGDPSFLISNCRGYALGDDIEIDVLELERLAQASRRARSDDRAAFDVLRGAFETLRSAAARGADRLPESLGGSVEMLTSEIGARFGVVALRLGYPQDALAAADALLALDPCDESGCEVAMRAHLALGDRAAALRVYRHYKAALALDIEVPPSRHLADILVGDRETASSIA